LSAVAIEIGTDSSSAANYAAFAPVNWLAPEPVSRTSIALGEENR